MAKHKKSAPKKSHYIKNDYFRRREDLEIGSLGGAISSEFGFVDLEAAKDYAESFKPWNAEEWDMFQERIRKNNKKKPN